MTTELEQEFYDTFGIKPKWKDKRVKSIKTYYTEEQAQYLRETTKNRNIQLCYPEITAEKLLEMICIINKSNFVKAVYLDDCNYTELENTIIKKTITIIKNEFLNKKLKDKFKQQIQQLFKEV